MVAAVPDYVGTDFGGAPPGHRFRLYWSGWWGAGLGQQRLAEADAQLARAQPREHRKLKKNVQRLTAELHRGVHLGETDEEERAGAVEFAPGVARTVALEIQKRQRFAARLLATSSRVLVCEGSSVTPLAIGLGNPHPLQNGFSFLDPYGLPFLPGSAVKGVLRRAAEDLAFRCDDAGWGLADVLALFGIDATSAYLKKDEQNAELHGRALATAEQMTAEVWSQVFSVAWTPTDRPRDVRAEVLRFLREPDRRERERLLPRFRGLLECWDVVPSASAGAPFRVDIMNPHQREYYEQKGWAMPGAPTKTPSEDQIPKPVNFMTVPAGAAMCFVLRYEGRGGLVPATVLDRWKPLLEQALHFAGEVNGFGAKTATGYGRVTFGTPRVGAAAGPTEGAETWQACSVRYEPGRKELVATASDGRRAFARQGEVDALFSKVADSLRDRVKRKKEAKGVMATVAREGNSFKLLSLSEGK